MRLPQPIRVLLLAALAWLPSAYGFDLEGYREDFLAAEAALKRGNLEEFELLSGFLEDYPLYPYLLYKQLLRDLGRVDPGAVDQFLVEFGDTSLAGRLRRAYLKRLAKEGRWETYARFASRTIRSSIVVTTCADFC